MLFNRYNIKAEVERKNLDLVKEKISLKEKERRTTNTELAKISFSMIGEGLKTFIYDKTMIYRVIMGLTGAYVVGIGCKSIFGLFTKYFSAKFMTPKLIRETSRVPLNRFYQIPLNNLVKFKQIINAGNTQMDIFKGIILKPELEEQLKIISKSIANRKKHFTPFRNLLLHGPPGTGKTLFAKQLAKKSGLDYAILTGADVAPLGTISVSEIHKLFDWAESSSNGILFNNH
jgi:ATPase family AAA domain-containing protein 3A/B